jgi:hypothetical protein
MKQNPTLKRVVQMTAVLILEPIFEADLAAEQHAYRAKHSKEIGRWLTLRFVEHRPSIDAERPSLGKFLWPAAARHGFRQDAGSDISGYPLF